MITQEFSMYLKCGSWMYEFFKPSSLLRSAKKLRWWNSFIQGPHFKYTENSCLYHLLSPHLLAYDRPTPSWPGSSTGGALLWHHRGQGLNSRPSLNFSGLSCCYLTNTKMRWSNSFNNSFLLLILFVFLCLKICRCHGSAACVISHHHVCTIQHGKDHWFYLCVKWKSLSNGEHTLLCLQNSLWSLSFRWSSQLWESVSHSHFW